MKVQALRYTGAALGVALLVVLAGVRIAGPDHRDAVVVGAAIGAAVQVAVFWALAVWLFPGRGWTAYGLGLLVRLAAFAVAAFVVAPRAGLPLAATLFSLVAVFWPTTMLEPLFLKTQPSNPTRG